MFLQVAVSLPYPGFGFMGSIPQSPVTGSRLLATLPFSMNTPLEGSPSTPKQMGKTIDIPASGSASAQTKRAANWSDEETDFIVSRWAQAMMQNNGKAERLHTSIYESLAHELQTCCGVDRTTVQVQIRLQNMRRIYRTIRRKPVEEHRRWRYFDVFDKCIGDRDEFHRMMVADKPRMLHPSAAAESGVLCSPGYHQGPLHKKDDLEEHQINIIAKPDPGDAGSGQNDENPAVTKADSKNV